MLAARWIPDVRKAALIASVTGGINVTIRSWRTLSSLAGMLSRDFPASLQTIPLTVAGLLVAAILPVFYFALYRNQGTVAPSRRMRFVCLAAGLLLCLYAASEVPGWIRYLGSYASVLREFDWSRGGPALVQALRDVSTANLVVAILSGLARVAYILPLFALFAQAEPSGRPPSLLLRRTSQVTAAALGLWAAFLLAQVVLAPLAWHRMRDIAASAGIASPGIVDVLRAPTLALVNLACLFVAPYAVYRSSKESDPEPVDDGGGEAAADGV